MKVSWTDLFDIEKQQENQKKWDLRFLDLAKRIAEWSKDPSTKCGAVITNGKRLVSVGFNGFPAGMHDYDARYEQRAEKYSRVVHAEVNALIMAERPVAGCTLYTYPVFCCDRCVVQMLQARIFRFVSPPLPAGMERWEDAINRAKSYVAEIGATWQHLSI